MITIAGISENDRQDKLTRKMLCKYKPSQAKPKPIIIIITVITNQVTATTAAGIAIATKSNVICWG